ncbi:MAG: hypothetical protein AB8U48_03755 [Anaplasma ovis]
MSRQQRKDRGAASVAQRQQGLQHSTGGTSKVKLKNELESAVEAHFLYGEGERLFTTRDPTGVEGAANVIKEKNLIIGPSANHNNLATSDISTLTNMMLRSAGESAHKVPEHVVAAWVAFYTPPEKRTTLVEILRACIAYPPNPQVDVSISDIKICKILPSPTPTASQQPQQKSWIRSFFSSKQEQSTATAVPEQSSRPPIGMRCEETIKFKVKDVGNSAPVEGVVMTIQYDLVAVHNKSSGTDDVELRGLSFCVTPATEFEQHGNSSANKCVWQARQRCTRVFLSTELNLIRDASKLEAADILDNSVMSGNGPQQASTLTYRQRLQMLLDVQEMQKQAKETHARISPQSTNSSTRKQILFKDTEFLKDNKDICTRIFVSTFQEAEEMLGAFVHTVIADSCADRRNTKPEYFQKISFKIPLNAEDAQEERYKVIEHGSVHIPLSGQNIHALLSYTVTTKRTTGSEHKPEVVISKAKLGVRHVPRGFKLHNCAWVRYRSTDFITFVIPDLTYTCVTSTLPTCWHQAKEYRAIVSPYPKKAVKMASRQEGIAPAEHHITVPVIQPGQGEGQKPWAIGASEKMPGAQSETKSGERSTDYAVSEHTNVHGTTDHVESDKPEHRINEKQRQWIDQMVTQAASTHHADTDEHSFESHITRFVEAHKQPNADSHTSGSGEAFYYDTPQESFGVNDIEEPEPQSEPESGRHPTQEKSVPHGSRSKTKKPLPHSEEKLQSQLLWFLLAIWKSILLIFQFLIVTPLVYIYKLCTQYAAQSPTTTTDVPEEASDKSAKKSATEKQKESTSFFAQLRRRAKNSSAATNETDADTPKPKKPEKRNKNAANTPTPGKAPDKEGAKRPTERKDVRSDQQTSNTAPTNTESNTEENPSDEDEVSSTMQEPKIENAFFEVHSVLYPM